MLRTVPQLSLARPPMAVRQGESRTPQEGMPPGMASSPCSSRIMNENPNNTGNNIANNTVSVVVPLYGEARHLITAVCSAAQRREVKEVLLMDDGTLPHVQTECRHLSQSLTKVRVCQHPQAHVDTSILLNFGVSQTTGEYLAFLCPDGYFLPGRFRQSVKALNENPEVDGVCVDVTHRFGPHLQDHSPRLASGLTNDQIFDMLLAGQRRDIDWSGILLRKSALIRAGHFAHGTDTYGTWVVTLIKLSVLCNLKVGIEKQPMAVRCTNEQISPFDEAVLLPRLIYWAENERIAGYYRSRLLAAYLNALPASTNTGPRISFLSSLIDTATRWPSVMKMPLFWRCVGKTLRSIPISGSMPAKRHNRGAAL